MKKTLLLTIFSLFAFGVKAQTQTADSSDLDKIKIKEPSFDAKITSNTEPIFATVETEPTFQGGLEKFYAYLQLNIVYPPDAVKKRVEGKVFVSFVVEKDGSLTNIKILRGVSPEIDTEAGRVVGNSPKWHPGRQNDTPVRAQFAIPITFKLPSESNVNSNFTPIEKVPQFPGGIEKFYKYLAKNLNYPEEAHRDGVQGKVFVSFVVERDGSLSDVKISESLSRETDAEAIRLIKSCPKWNPGMQNGQPVRVAFTVPIPFEDK